jgi:trk system potassium uptake protein TrkA
MNIIIVGAGEIGRHLAAELSAGGHRVSVVEKDAAIAAQLESLIDAKVIHGNGSSVSDLVEAGAGDCGLLLAMTSSNTANLVACSMAKGLNVPIVVSRVHPGLQREEWLFDYRGHFRIDHIFSSERLAAVELAKHVRNPDGRDMIEIANGRIELQQVTVGRSSDVAGVSLRKLKPPGNVRVAMVNRGGRRVVPGADFELSSDDEVTAFGEPRRLRDFAARLRGREEPHVSPRVVVFGGNEYGFTLAQMLESFDCKVRIFERDAALCAKLVGRLANTTIINADASVESVLQEEQVGQADFFISTSPDDEDNVMSCMQAHTLGAKRCLTLVHRADYARAISANGHKIGIHAAVSPRLATEAEIRRFITTTRCHTIRALDETELVEARVGTGAPVCGLAVRDAGLPAGAVLVGRIRGIHAKVPGADDTLEAGDHLYAVVEKRARRPFEKRVIG